MQQIIRANQKNYRIMETEQKPKSEIDLRKLMQKLGMGTNAFAKACGMSTQSMAQFFRNKSLTTTTIYRIAMALDMDPRDMFFPTDEEEDAQPLAEDVEDTVEGGDDGERHENEANVDTSDTAQPAVVTTAFCPHCGARVRVGVVLLPEP